jgi:hypothetical protein
MRFMLALAVMLSATAVGIGEGAAVSGSRTVSGRCWTRGAPVRVGSRTTTRYLVVPNHVSCAFAKPWVTRLSHKRGAPASAALSGGPPGWDCFTSAPGKRAATGFCARHTGPKSFDWSRSIGKAPAS